MPEEVFNPPGEEGDPLRSESVAIEAAACVALARWLAQNRPDLVGVEFDGAGRDLWFVNMITVDAEVSSATQAQNPELWTKVLESWELLRSVGRASHRLVSPDEARHWRRGGL